MKESVERLINAKAFSGLEFMKKTFFFMDAKSCMLLTEAWLGLNLFS